MCIYFSSIPDCDISERSKKLNFLTKISSFPKKPSWMWSQIKSSRVLKIQLVSQVKVPADYESFAIAF